MSKPNRNNKNEQDNNKRPLESNDGNVTLVSTPKKKRWTFFVQRFVQHLRKYITTNTVLS